MYIGIGKVPHYARHSHSDYHSDDVLNAALYIGKLVCVALCVWKVDEMPRRRLLLAGGAVTAAALLGLRCAHMIKHCDARRDHNADEVLTARAQPDLPRWHAGPARCHRLHVRGGGGVLLQLRPALLAHYRGDVRGGEKEVRWSRGFT